MYQSRTEKGNIGPSGEIADREGKYWIGPQEGPFAKMILYISRCLNNDNELSFSK